MRRFPLLLTLAAALPAGLAHAQTVVSAPGTAYQTAALSDFTTLGNDMGGMEITAYFGAMSSTLAWGDLGSGTWGVQNGMFRLVLGELSDTFDTPWRLENLNPTGGTLTRLVFRGAPGNTVFDRSDAPGSTPGSSTGNDFQFTGGAIVGSTATYTNIINLTGFPAEGDLFEMVDVAFGPGGLAAGSALSFVMDTDNAGVGELIRPVVPEPGTYVLLGTGLAALGVVARRRRTA